MTREAKIGLLVSLLIIIGVGVIVNDHLTATNNGNLDPDNASRTVTQFEPESGGGAGQAPQPYEPSPAVAEPSRIEEEDGSRTRGTRYANAAAHTTRLPRPEEDQSHLTSEEILAQIEAEANRGLAAGEREAQALMKTEGAGPGAAAGQKLASNTQAVREPERINTRTGGAPPSGTNMGDRVWEQINGGAARRGDESSRYGAAANARANTHGLRGVGEKTHTVRDNESLWVIAEQHYGNGIHFTVIKEANADVLRGGDQVFPGMKLTIPDRAAGDASRGSSVRAMANTSQRAPAIEPHTRPGYVRVRKNDTLSELAQRHMGSARRWYELYQANLDVIDDPDWLTVGTMLRIPTVTREAAAPRTTRSLGPRQYAVRQGDSLWRIAERQLGNGARWYELYESNRDVISDPDKLVLGQVLDLP